MPGAQQPLQRGQTDRLQGQTEAITDQSRPPAALVRDDVYDPISGMVISVWTASHPTFAAAGY